MYRTIFDPLLTKLVMDGLRLFWPWLIYRKLPIRHWKMCQTILTIAFKNKSSWHNLVAFCSGSSFLPFLPLKFFWTFLSFHSISHFCPSWHFATKKPKSHNVKRWQCPRWWHERNSLEAFVFFPLWETWNANEVLIMGIPGNFFWWF